jgi:glycine oxidase
VRARSYDVIIAGAGLIGIALALELRKQGERVIVFDKGEPGREASYASGGMLASSELSEPKQLAMLAAASARQYPEFISEIEAEAGMKVDFSRAGAIDFTTQRQDCQPLTESELRELEPEVEYAGEPGYFVEENFVDPRSLLVAALAAARRRGIEFASGSPVTSVVSERGRIVGVRTEQTAYAAPVVVNCCGAWAGELGMRNSPVSPVKGQMLALLPGKKPLIKHVIRSRVSDVYLIPRASGLIAVGSTVENAGFDKAVVPDTILKLHQMAANFAPVLGEALIQESWAGLRPGTPDGLPIMGEGESRGYFINTGHFRNGILLAPISARVLTRQINGGKPEFDTAPFSPARFA